MAAGDELVDFVRDALGRDVPRPQIEERFARAVGLRIVRGALAAFADVDFPVPCRARPYSRHARRSSTSVLFGTLYTSAFYLGSLIFDIINLTFPDPAQESENYATYIRSSMRWSTRR